MMMERGPRSDELKRIQFEAVDQFDECKSKRLPKFLLRALSCRLDGQAVTQRRDYLLMQEQAS